MVVVWGLFLCCIVRCRVKVKKWGLMSDCYVGVWIGNGLGVCLFGVVVNL